MFNDPTPPSNEGENIFTAKDWIVASIIAALLAFTATTVYLLFFNH